MSREFFGQFLATQSKVSLLNRFNFMAIRFSRVTQIGAVHIAATRIYLILKQTLKRENTLKCNLLIIDCTLFDYDTK